MTFWDVFLAFDRWSEKTQLTGTITLKSGGQGSFTDMSITSLLDSYGDCPVVRFSNRYIELREV